MVGWLEPGKMEHPQFREAIGGGAGSRRGSLHAQRRSGRPACANFVVPKVQLVCLAGANFGDFRGVPQGDEIYQQVKRHRETHGTRGRTRAHGSRRTSQPSKPLWSREVLARGENTGNAVPVKRHRGEPGHTQDTRALHGRTRAHGSHRRTSQPSQPTNAPAYPQHDSATAQGDSRENLSTSLDRRTADMWGFPGAAPPELPWDGGNPGPSTNGPLR